LQFTCFSVINRIVRYETWTVFAGQFCCCY